MATNNELARIEQNRAGFAFDCVMNVLNKCGNQTAADYKSYVKRLPMLIKNNGLAPALAYIFSKSGKSETQSDINAYSLIYHNIGDWLKEEQCKHLITDINNKDIKGIELIEEIVKVSSEQYRALTLEILAFLNWLKRFADGKIEDKKE